MNLRTVLSNAVEKASLTYLCLNKVHTYLNVNRPVLIRSFKTFIVALLCGILKSPTYVLIRKTLIYG